jgi:ABC-2 type transport system ATP-binding protein
MTDALVAERVRKEYGDVVALDGVSLTVESGEVFGLIGPNGAGKTTLTRALTGTTRVEGTVRVLGSAPNEVDPQRIGLLPQSFSPASRLTASELVSYYAGLYDEARDPDAVLADVGMADDADVHYENLSGGQQRRTCVATALVNDPDVLFLDEPTTGIDPAGRRALWTLLEDLAAGGTTIFLTSHSMTEVERLADRVGLLSRGEVVAVGTPSSLVAEHGGTNRLVVRTDADTDAVARTEFPVEAADGELVVHDVDADDIGTVVASLEAASVDYESLVWRQPGLEEVYLRLTGEQFEGASAAAVAADTGVTTGADAGAGGAR